MLKYRNLNYSKPELDDKHDETRNMRDRIIVDHRVGARLGKASRQMERTPCLVYDESNKRYDTQKMYGRIDLVIESSIRSSLTRKFLGMCMI